ncbi:MAG TPA: glycosyltransferase [Chloroflexia bacterium]|nr:glycosyltransferase [Chloroflexia bacterium]
MRLLFLAPYLPSPPQSGAPRRVHGLLTELARRHEVTILAFSVPGEDTEGARRATGEYCVEVVTVENDHLDRALTGKRKRAVQLRSLLAMHSFERLAYYHPLFQRALDDLAARRDFDVVTVEHAQMACYRLPSGPRLILDEHNIEYDILWRTTTAEKPSIRKLYNWANYQKLRCEERAAWRQFDGITLTSARDELLLRRDASRKLTAVIPNGVDTSFFNPSGIAVEPDTILFFGAMNYYPNIEGILYFLNDIFPRVKRQRPGARLLVVGQQPPPSILERASDDIVVTGLVDDVRPYLERAAVAIAPLRIGGGTRLKIVEAMSMGKAIVATSLGAEGLHVKDGVDILLGDTAEDFARHVVRVLDDPLLAQRLGEAARHSAEAQYSWWGAVNRLERFYGELPPSRRTR